MAKKSKQTRPAQAPAAQDKPATLKDLLDPKVLEKLKAQANDLKQEEEDRKATKRQQEEEARKAEQKRKENDFEYLLNNTKQDWKQYK
ncbi:YqkE family protein [Paenibacillus terrigena]|uniref:YqkE family protein n=1 Tax=Paenibacillus terrigena TaxID=369333 RepID=UPI00035C4069|nr:YqkE family protein [Paenibacillus terrigena]